MGNRNFIYKGEEYSFSKLKYITCFDKYRRDHALTKTQLDIQISEICNIGPDAVKKWRGTKESGTSPSDINIIEKMAIFFNLNSVDNLLSKVEMEDNNIMNSLNERQAIKNAIKAFASLIKVFQKTKTECDSKLLQVAVNNYNLFMTEEKEDIVECSVHFDGDVYIYDDIVKEADNTAIELVAESIDLPKELMESILMLIHQIVYEDETEKNYMTDERVEYIMEVQKEFVSTDDIKCCNDSAVLSAAFDYCKKFNELIERYNISIKDYTYLMYM